jgi:hypothetical protein
MLIGDTVTYDGQVHTVVGFTAMSVRPAEVELLPKGRGESFWIDRRLLEEPLAPERAALRLPLGRMRRKT